MDNKDLLESIRIMLKEELKKELDPIKREQEIMKKRQDEIFNVVKSIEHSNNTHKAEIDNLNHRVSNVEGILNGMSEVFN